MPERVTSFQTFTRVSFVSGAAAAIAEWVAEIAFIDSRRMREKLLDRRGDFVAVRLERKVAGINEAHVGVGDIAFECLGAGRQKERIVLAPHCQKRRLVLAEVALKCRI